MHGQQLGDLREKFSREPSGQSVSLLKQSKARTVTMKQLVPIFCSLKGMFGLPRFPLIFLFMKSKGANFA